VSAFELSDHTAVLTGNKVRPVQPISIAMIDSDRTHL